MYGTLGDVRLYSRYVPCASNGTRVSVMLHIPLLTVSPSRVTHPLLALKFGLPNLASAWVPIWGSREIFRVEIFPVGFHCNLPGCKL